MIRFFSEWDDEKYFVDRQNHDHLNGRWGRHILCMHDIPIIAYKSPLYFNSVKKWFFVLTNHTLYTITILVFVSGRSA